MKTDVEAGKDLDVSSMNLPFFLWTLNPLGEIIDVNYSLNETLGYQRDQLIGKHFVSLYPDTHKQFIQEQITALNNENLIFFSRPILSVSGAMIPVDAVILKNKRTDSSMLFGCGSAPHLHNEYPIDTSTILADQTFECGQETFTAFVIDIIKRLEVALNEIYELKEEITRLTHEDAERSGKENRERKYFEKEISKKNILLAEKNITLKQLLDQRDKEKQEIKDEIYKKVQSLILPLIGRIQTNGTEADKRYLQAVLHNMQEIISPLSSETARKMAVLSSRELEICNLILQGCNSKEIAEMLCLSIQTVNTHRKNMRRKLKLTATGINLFTYVKSEAPYY